jgi:4'-phosphopantetheinyl transferase
MSCCAARVLWQRGKPYAAVNRAHSAGACFQNGDVMSATGRIDAGDLADSLVDKVVHVWYFSLLTDTPYSTECTLHLSLEERRRAMRIRRPKLRDRFRAAKATVRCILAGYLRADPASLSFISGAHGKPALSRKDTWPDIRFNVSHAEDLGACAVTCGREVGIDVEWVRAGHDLDRMIVRALSAAEAPRLRAARADDPGAFYASWTRKEAYLKAVGVGLSVPLTSGGSPTTELSPHALEDRDSAASPSRWTVRALRSLPAGYVGAIAAEGADWYARSRWWPDDAGADPTGDRS